MNPFSALMHVVSDMRSRVHGYTVRRRWAKLCENGMRIGADVWLPDSTWIDPNYCFLISIGDHCGFGAECLILAHDAQMDEFIDAARIGRVAIHPSYHIDARTVSLPGVEIGPRTSVGANCLVSRSLPPDTVCMGAPARVVYSLGEYLGKHRSRLLTHPTFDYKNRALSVEERSRMVALLSSTDGYITGVGVPQSLVERVGHPERAWLWGPGTTTMTEYALMRRGQMWNGRRLGCSGSR